ncbi:MAG: leucine-rich repeat domain-containing protein [Oscillospiraceae bacterium]|nr:leucine-rich repeat domain-containing protein [Oscillospiraceae bacterium]
MKMKLSIIISLLLALSLSACSGNEARKDGGNGYSGNSQEEGSTKDNPGILFPEPVKELCIWDVLPEIPVTDVSAFEYKYDNDLGGICITGYNGQALKVRIPDTIEGEPVVGVNLSNCYKELIELIMPDSVKKFSFSGMFEYTLKYLNIPGAAQSYPSFKGWKLESVYISSGVTEISSVDFEKCESLTNVAIPGSVTETYGFDGCTSLTSVIISNGVTVVGGFNDCTSLTSVTIPDSVTEICTSYGAAFDGCTSLNAVYKGKSYDYENIGFLYDAINMVETGLKIKDGVLKDVSRALTEVVIPDSVTEISDWAFSDCKRLTSVTIPDSVTKIGGNAFNGYEKIQVTYKGKVYNSDTMDLLYDAINLGETGIKIEDGVLEDVSRGLTEVVIPDNVTKISGYAFSGCTRLTSVTIP